MKRNSKAAKSRADPSKVHPLFRALFDTFSEKMAHEYGLSFENGLEKATKAKLIKPEVVRLFSLSLTFLLKS